MKISIVTVVRNGVKTIEDTIHSVRDQSYHDVEHIIVDGASTDGTMDVVNRYRDGFAVVISEPDQGIYDAMNKGIAAASGDVIGILNADDIYQDETVLRQVAEAHSDPDLDACYANLVYVDSKQTEKVVRRWRSQAFEPGLCFKGWMPAHPTLFLKKRVYQSVGEYDTGLRFQSDLEYCARLFEVHKINSLYVPRLWVRMRMGGVSNKSWRNIVAGNRESFLALKKLGLERTALSFFAHKFAGRLRQFF